MFPDEMTCLIFPMKQPAAPIFFSVFDRLPAKAVPESPPQTLPQPVHLPLDHLRSISASGWMELKKAKVKTAGEFQ